MSIYQMTKVWEHDFPYNQQLIMLAMADHANDAGKNIYPSIKRIAWKTGYSERNIQRIITKLKNAGILVEVRPAAHHRPTEYEINWTNAPKKAPYEEGRQDVAPEEKRGDSGDGSGVTSRDNRGDTTVESGVTQLRHPNRHLNRQIKPSENRQAKPPPDFLDRDNFRKLLGLPEILIYRKVTGRSPGQPQMPIIYETIRENEFTEEDIQPYWEEWVERGYNPRSLKWLTEWAVRQDPVIQQQENSRQEYDPDRYTKGEFSEFIKS